MNGKRNIWLPVILMIVFALTRWPGVMPANFSAAYALAFCAGVYFPKRLAWWLPLGTLLATDLLLNGHYGAPLLGPEMLGNYAAYLALLWLGKQFHSKSSWLGLLSGGLLGSILFYLITNTISWLHDPIYPKTVAGWIQALTVGTPGWPQTWQFFRNTLLSGGLFTGLFAGAMKLSEAAESAREKAPAEGEEDQEPAGAKAEPEESKA